MKYIPQRKWLAFAGLILVLGGLLVAAYVSMTRIPKFYRQALLISNSENSLAGREFEGRLADLVNQIRNEDVWSVCWTDQQINGWLAVDLPRKFRGVVSQSLIHPRIAIDEDELRLAFQFQRMGLRGIVEIRGEVFSTEVDNQIALRVEYARCGFFPIPVAWWAERLQVALTDWDIGIEWTELENDPVALINLPPTLGFHEEQRVVLQGIQLSPSTIALAGQTVVHQSDSSQSGADVSADNIQRSGESSMDPRFK